MHFPKHMLGAGLLACIPYSFAATAPIVGCEAAGGLEPICGLNGSEDLEVLPGRKQLLVSQSNVDFSKPPALLWRPGSIAVVDLATKTPRVLYPANAQASASKSWGDAHCPGEIGSRLSPHGLHLSTRANGTQQLLVVNHGDRESVEMFEVLGQGAELKLSWRGCAVAPEHSMLNDVTAAPGGGFFVTHMTYNDGPEALMNGRQRGEKGENTGHVLRWSQTGGYSILPGSASPMPNGIQVDKAGAYAYVNVMGEMRKLDLKTAQWAGRFKTSHPDNVSWSEDGRLLVTGLLNPADVGPCMAATFARPCGALFTVTAIDPITMTGEVLLQHEGAPMGFGTGTVQAGDFLYVGSVAGDRILKAPLPKKQ